MAINWELDISDVNVASKRADVRFTRTDSESSLAPQTYSFQNTIVETPAQRAALLDSVKESVKKDATKQAAIDAFVTDLEQAGKANLEAWEATR